MNNTKNLLTVPVHYKLKLPINEIKIDNTKNWKKKQNSIKLELLKCMEKFNLSPKMKIQNFTH